MNIDEIRARAEAATPGPWIATQKGNTVKSMVIKGVCGGMSAMRDDYRFIAHAREDISYLLAEVERLTAELTDYHHSQKIIDGQMKQLERLRKINEALAARAEAAEAERDAVIADWKAYELDGQCVVCKYAVSGDCAYPNNKCNFEWRGAERSE